MSAGRFSGITSTRFSRRGKGGEFAASIGEPVQIARTSLVDIKGLEAAHEIMNRKELKKIEQEYLEAFEKAEGITAKCGPETVRSMVRQTAYHEAGHLAAHMFTGRSPRDIEWVTIIPTASNIGCMRLQHNTDEIYLPRYHSTDQINLGRRLLLQMLAGRGAEYRVTDRDDRENILDMDSEEWDTEGTDLAERIESPKSWSALTCPRDVV